MILSLDKDQMFLGAQWLVAWLRSSYSNEKHDKPNYTYAFETNSTSFAWFDLLNCADQFCHL